MDLNGMQNEVVQWSEKNFGKQDPYRPLLGVCEEVGELAHHFLKMRQGIRGDSVYHLNGIKDAVGDILIYLMDFCGKMGIDLQAELNHTWKQVRRRDWVKDPKSGGEGDHENRIA